VSSTRRRRDPIFGAAVLKYTFQRRKDEQSPQFKAIYEGVLRDLKVTDEQVEAFLAEHLDEVAESIKAHGKSNSDDE
jgi:CRISPR/Cas system CSM-associated protein Csm2 small subunit